MSSRLAEGFANGCDKAEQRDALKRQYFLSVLDVLLLADLIAVNDSAGEGAFMLMMH
mgnify:FL=1